MEGDPIKDITSFLTLLNVIFSHIDTEIQFKSKFLFASVDSHMPKYISPPNRFSFYYFILQKLAFLILYQWSRNFSIIIIAIFELRTDTDGDDGNTLYSIKLPDDHSAENNQVTPLQGKRVGAKVVKINPLLVKITPSNTLYQQQPWELL